MIINMFSSVKFTLKFRSFIYHVSQIDKNLYGLYGEGVVIIQMYRLLCLECKKHFGLFQYKLCSCYADVNWCALARCDHTCENTTQPPYYRCGCRDGYQLNNDNKSCRRMYHTVCVCGRYFEKTKHKTCKVIHSVCMIMILFYYR